MFHLITMENLIAPVDPQLIEKELTNELLLRKSNNGNTLLYHFTAAQAPHTMQELGRLRELTFREAGGGTGKAVDIDEFDTAEYPYSQLIVWDPEERKILGGYRYIAGNVGVHPCKLFATGELFNFSDRFVNDYLPYTIELGRSFVHPAYQSTGLRRKGIYALDNLWDGLGALVVLNPWMKYFFGKVTMYPHYNADARTALLYYIERFYPDNEKLVRPITPLQPSLSKNELESIFTGSSRAENHEILLRYLSERNERIPPLIKSYTGLSDSMKMFGTAINPGFGDVEETGILVTVDDIFPEKKARHINTFQH